LAVPRPLTVLLQGLFALLLWAALPASAGADATSAPRVEASQRIVFLPGLNENEADDHQKAVAAVFSVSNGDDDPRTLAASYQVFAIVPRDTVISDLGGLHGVKPALVVRALPPTGPPSV
jgi:hypothetical protein